MKAKCVLIVTFLTVLCLTACGPAPAKTAPTQAPQKAAATQQQPTTQQEAATPTQLKPTETPQPKPTSSPVPTATPVPSRTPVPTPTAKPADPGTSRSAPLPLNTEFKGKTWSVVVSDVTRGQGVAQAIAKANQFNEPPRQGFEYLIANVKLTNISDKQEAQDVFLSISLRVTGDRNVIYSSASVVEPKRLQGKLFPKGIAEGQIAFEIPSGEKNLMFIVGEAMSFDAKATRLLAIDKDAKIIPAASLRDVKATDLGKRRDSPAKIGDTLVAGAWEFKILEAVRGDKAAELAKKANQFNEPAKEDQEYVAVKLKARYLGTTEPDRSENISGGYLKITGEKNVVYESPSIVPPEPKLDATLFAGGEAEGWEVLSVSKGEKGLMVVFSPLFSFTGDATRYIAIE